MNYQQLEKIFGPPLMDEPLKQVTAHKPQIKIIQILIALGIGYFFIKGVIYFLIENQIIQLKKVDVKK